MSFNSGFSCHIVFSHEWFIPMSMYKHSEHSYFSYRNPKRGAITLISRQRVTVFHALHEIDVVGLYDSNSRRVKGVEYFEILDIDAQPEGEQFQHNACFQQDGAFYRLTWAVRSLLDGNYHKSWIGRSFPTDKQARSLEPAGWRFFSADLWGIKCIELLCLNQTHSKEK